MVGPEIDNDRHRHRPSHGQRRTLTLESGKSYDVIFAVIGDEAGERLAAINFIINVYNAAADAVNIFNAIDLTGIGSGIPRFGGYDR